MRYPKFSIIIPAHNEELSIERAIESIQKQTYKNFEIIISNDGSTDKTREIVESMMKKDKRIRILNRDKGHSAAFARNRGAEVAKGEILVFLDADTLVNDTFLQEILKKSRFADAFLTLNYPLKQNLLSKILSSFIGKPKRESLQDGTIFSVKKNNPEGAMFFCIKRSAFLSLRGYNEDIFYYEDEDFKNKFYATGFKSIFVKKANQFFELPSTFSEFLRQCKWIGKGINTIPNKRDRINKRITWFLKSIFLLSPIFFLNNLTYFLITLFLTAGLSYLLLLKRNRDISLSFFALPFFYIKTFLVSLNVLKFWKI